MTVVLGLCADGSQELSPFRDGETGVLPTFSEEFNTVAVYCARMLKEADPFCPVWITVWDWEVWKANGQPLVDDEMLPAEAVELVGRVAAVWRARVEAKT